MSDYKFFEFVMQLTWFSWKISISDSEPLIFVKEKSFVIMAEKQKKNDKKWQKSPDWNYLLRSY